MMDYQDGFDRKLKNDLNRIANTIETPPHLFNKIKAEINNKERSEKNMRKPFIFHRKLKIVMVAAICMVVLLGGIVGAKSLISQHVKGFLTSDTTYNSIDEELIMALGFSPKMPEVLPEGFQRTKIRTADYIDGANQQQPFDSSQKLISAYYEKTDRVGAVVSLTVSNTSKDSDMFSVYEDIPLNDVQLQYKSYEVYVLPSDYELSEEEMEKEKNDEIFIVYVSDVKEKEIKNAQCIKWVDNGIYYMLSDHKNSISKDSIIEMAQSIIHSK